MAVVALVSCVKSKLEGEWPAEELYCSTGFKAARAYARLRSDRWFILSARHGLLGPRQRISSYEETLKGKAIDDRRHWARRVLQQITDVQALQPGDSILWLAGNTYQQHLAPLLDAYLHEHPLANKRQGEQIQWLQRAVASTPTPP